MNSRPPRLTMIAMVSHMTSPHSHRSADALAQKPTGTMPDAPLSLCAFTRNPVLYPDLGTQNRRHAGASPLGTYNPGCDSTLKQTHGGFSGLSKKRMCEQTGLLIFRLQSLEQF